MSQINKYEITTLHGKHEEKHIINALTAQDAITQFKVKINCERYRIVNIEPYVTVWNGEQIIRINRLIEQSKLRHKQQKQSENKLNRILYGLLRFGH